MPAAKEDRRRKIPNHMKCPHCLQNFSESWKRDGLIEDKRGGWNVLYCKCPNEKCNQIILEAMILNSYGNLIDRFRMWPTGTSRNPVPMEVEESFASDYEEACDVLVKSPKASAALSRRCLQHILREKAGVKPQSLDKEIQEVLDSGMLPSDLSDQLDQVRAIGNFAAHPIKSTNSGEVVDVEEGEAEWNLDVIEELFDFYFVRPVRIAERKAKVNAKLQEAGKPTLK